MSLPLLLRLAARQWARQPRLAAMVVLTLALGIGGATTMYAVLQAITQSGRPTLPAADEVGRVFSGMPYEADARGPLTLSDVHRLSPAASIATLAPFVDSERLLDTAEGGEEIQVRATTAGYFSVLRSAPVIGRTFADGDSRTGGVRLAVLGERAWRSRFAADTGVLGRTLALDGQAYTLIGVVPERLGLVSAPIDVIVPLGETDGRTTVRVFVRRRAQASWSALRAELKGIGVDAGSTRRQLRVVPILEDAGYRTRMGWLGMVGPALLVLLIGCGNVASLLLVRAVQREREMATRLALGASRTQLAAQLLAEGLTLAAAGGVLGVLLAFAGLEGAQALIPASFELIRLQLDDRALAFAAVATVLTPLLFGVTPLLHGLRLDLSSALRAGLRKPLLGVRQYHLRDLFAILQVGVAVGLVLFTFMLLSLFSAASRIGLGFEGEGLIVASLRPARGEAPSPDAAADLRQRLREQAAALPGVTRATVGSLPYRGTRAAVSRADANDPDVPAGQVAVDGTYFETLRLPVVRGRAIDDRDRLGTAPVAVVSESLARRLWPEQDPIGLTLRVADSGRSETLTVVGVARDALRLGRLGRLEGTEFDGLTQVLYRPWAQTGAGPLSTVAARVQGRPDSRFQPFRDAIRAVDSQLRVRRVFALEATFDVMGDKADSGMRTPVVALQLGLCSLALLLGIVGVFGVMRQLVDERRAELGVRLALGASPRSLVRSVVADGLIRVGVGAVMATVIVGVLARFGFTGLVSVSAADPRLWLATVAAVSLTAAAACWIPARHAARVAPMEVLRCE